MNDVQNVSDTNHNGWCVAA